MAALLTTACGGGGSPTVSTTPTPAPEPNGLSLTSLLPGPGTSLVVEQCTPEAQCVLAISGTVKATFDRSVLDAAAYIEFVQDDGTVCAVTITSPRAALGAGRSSTLAFSFAFTSIEPTVPQMCQLPFTTSQLVATLLDGSDTILMSQTVPMPYTFQAHSTLANSTPAPTPDPGGGKQCCKTCTNGKACGDSCISRSFKCNKGPGCACDASRDWFELEY